MNYNIVAAIQCYNMGYGNMQTILKTYAVDTNRTVDQILNDKNDTGWLDYRYLVTQGDQEYVEHVLSWIGDDLDISVLKDNKEPVCLNIQSNSKKTSMM